MAGTHQIVGHTEEYMTRAAEMVRLRSQGLTLVEIGSRYDVSRETVRQSIKAAVAAIPYEAVNELRHIQLDSLQLQKRRLLRIFLVDHPKVDHGRVVKHPDAESGEMVPVIDYDITIRASAELRHIEQDISRLTGTRAPVVHEVHEITEDAIDAELRSLATAIKQRSEAIGIPPPIDALSWAPGELEPAGKVDSPATAEAAGS